MSQAAIVATDLEKNYGTTPALRGVSLSVGAGELFGLVGPDGAGKTTFLRILAGLLSLSGGRIEIDGLDVSKEPARVKEHIGYMSQRFSLAETLTVAENLFYVCEIWHVPRAEQKARVQRLLDFSRLGAFQDRLARNLSGGMKQKLSLCACLVHQPRILLLDEPTIGVDPLSRRDFWLILYDLLQEGSTIFLSTPYMDEAERCHRVGFLIDGQLIACGRPSELRASLGSIVQELRCGEPRRARHLLHDVAALGAAVPFGESLHISVPRQGFAAESAVATARAAGVSIDSWRLIEPSLEDVFLAYLNRYRTQHGEPAAAAGSAA